MKKKPLRVETNVGEILDQVLALKDMLRKRKSECSADLYKKVMARLSRIMPCSLGAYYNILGGHSNFVIGRTTGIGISGTVAEEPSATYVQISKKEYDKELE